MACGVVPLAGVALAVDVPLLAGVTLAVPFNAALPEADGSDPPTVVAVDGAVPARLFAAPLMLAVPAARLSLGDGAVKLPEAEAAFVPLAVSRFSAIAGRRRTG